MRVERIVGSITRSIGLMLLCVAPVVAQVVDGGYRIFRPDGPGPHPVVVFVSGCSGFTPALAPKAYERPAEQLRELGFVVIWADYLGRRNLTTCAGGAIKQEEAGRDAVAAASWLRSQPYVDAKRIAVLGWSFGGGAVLSVLSTHRLDELIFTRAVVYYPYCQIVTPWSHRMPVLVLQAGADNVAPHHLCEFALDGSSKKGGVKVITYAGAHHAFDLSGLPPKMNYQFGTIGHDPKAAAAAWEEVKRFLQRKR